MDGVVGWWLQHTHFHLYYYCLSLSLSLLFLVRSSRIVAGGEQAVYISFPCLSELSRLSCAYVREMSGSAAHGNVRLCVRASVLCMSFLSLVYTKV